MSKNSTTVLPSVTLQSRWHEIFGRKPDVIDAKERFKRWQQWLNLAKDQEYGEEIIEHWTDSSACENCRHLDNGWCKYMGLPCTVNPVLTFNDNIMGMACMGLAKDIEPTQLNLW